MSDDNAREGVRTGSSHEPHADPSDCTTKKVEGKDAAELK